MIWVSTSIDFGMLYSTNELKGLEPGFVSICQTQQYELVCEFSFKFPALYECVAYII